MQVVFQGDLEDPSDERKAVEILKVDDLKLALWDTQQLFRNSLKYENTLHPGYLTSEEDKVVEILQTKFRNILEEYELIRMIEEQ